MTELDRNSAGLTMLRVALGAAFVLHALEKQPLFATPGWEVNLLYITGFSALALSEAPAWLSWDVRLSAGPITKRLPTPSAALAGSNSTPGSRRSPPPCTGA